MTLGEKQRLFVQLIGELIMWCYENDYELSFGETIRSKAQAEAYAAAGIGIVNTNHSADRKLAIDLNLFMDSSIEADEDIYQRDSEAYRPLGEYWKSLHPLCRWGGDFKDANGNPKPDGNHFSLEHEGVK